MQTSISQHVAHLRAGAGETLNVIGEQVTIRLTTADTNGAFMMAELLLHPGGGPPPHTHLSAEVFVIHEGELEFTRMVDGVLETFRAGAGDSVFIPGDVVHTYSTVSDTPSKSTVFFTPGGDMERFFRELADVTRDAQPGPPTPEMIAAVVAISEKHGGRILLPS